MLHTFTVPTSSTPAPDECIKHQGMGVINNEVYITGKDSGDSEECLQNCQTDYATLYGAYFTGDVCECIIKEGAELGVPLMPDGHVVYICNREGNYLSFRLIVYLTTGVSMINQLTS